MEEYKDIPGYEGLYQVSNLGNVKSLTRYRTYQNTSRLVIGRIIKYHLRGGYKRVSLSDNCNIKQFCIHQLVAMAFLGHKRQNKDVVDHIDNNKLNNCVSNLQIISNRENCSKDRKGISKYTGVTWNRNRKKWIAQIYILDRLVYLGGFDDEYEASIAYNNKLTEINDKII